ncbi:hypothetical protein KKA13_03465 [Patescibacteria group bacterium]|nr:hypothetical protein [Patescibacteria group bacterium]
MFKKITIYFFITLISLAPMTVSAFDYGISTTQKATGGLLPTQVAKASDPVKLVGNIIGLGLSLLAIAFFFLIFYSGLVWMTAHGKTERVEKAKNTLEAAIIGLLIVVFAYAITNFVLTGLGG